ncbi:hypothetical protein MKW92_000202 [Papaver armeniacum]|nr:hypothetical protein MKW92_000202 [Papaver armeniacum]
MEESSSLTLKQLNKDTYCGKVRIRIARLWIETKIPSAEVINLSMILVDKDFHSCIDKYTKD